MWARQRIEHLEGEPTLHGAEIRRLGLGFGLVTSQTSLIVLDSVADYVRHGIEPPPTTLLMVKQAGAENGLTYHWRGIDDISPRLRQVAWRRSL